MRLIVGLGNPGPRYTGSPHNVGFAVVDHFAEHHFGFERSGSAPHAPVGVGWAERFEAQVALGSVEGAELALLKPLTFMNRSGESVRKAMSFFKIPEDAALVVHDEIDLPLGSIRLKRGGGEAGHNGLKSVSAELGTRDYVRLRVGVGRPADGDVTGFLLSPLASPAADALAASVDDARIAIELWIRLGLEPAMNRVNRRPAPAGSTAG